MKLLTGRTKAKLKELGAFHTASEIYSQPQKWREVVDIHQSWEFKELYSSVGSEYDKIIFVGAGTSEFAGGFVANYLKPHIKTNVLSLSTADIVENPTLHLDGNEKILMVSFARSGNSPESIACVEISNHICSNIQHLIITCNEEGALYRLALTHNKYRAMLMPEGTNDVGFAMTSSISSMMIAALCTFMPKGFETAILEVADAVDSLLEQYSNSAQDIARQHFDRIVYLGSGALKSIAQEASLKMLELTAGKVACQFDSPLAYRHGPKSFITPNTYIISLFSKESYTVQYDKDVYKEIINDGIGYTVKIDVGAISSDLLAFPYLVFAQLVALEKSIHEHILPDTPCLTGEVNRVVQGVTIFPFTK
ncbi:SIS domain-containing protein [Vibrio artabrorum]|uniref:SIS domain-containing protein n=1 Tax=Vibrio artabrorum TaxID=446374 RepID=UPI00355313B9